MRRLSSVRRGDHDHPFSPRQRQEVDLGALARPAAAPPPRPAAPAAAPPPRPSRVRCRGRGDLERVDVIEVLRRQSSKDEHRTLLEPRSKIEVDCARSVTLPRARHVSGASLQRLPHPRARIERSHVEYVEVVEGSGSETGREGWRRGVERELSKTRKRAQLANKMGCNLVAQDRSKELTHCILQIVSKTCSPTTRSCGGTEPWARCRRRGLPCAIVAASSRRRARRFAL